MNVTIRPGKAVGTAIVPTSKSMAHRLLICAGLACGTSRITGLDMNDDISATIDCLRALGATCTIQGNTATVTGTDLRKVAPTKPLACRESGSTLRFFIPLTLLCGKGACFAGAETLLHRPLAVYEQLPDVSFVRSETRLQVQGILEGGNYALPGDVSSQFISGLLFALPLAAKDSRILITTPPESRPYIDLTLQALRTFGVQAQWEGNSLFIPGAQQYRPTAVAVEGDWSAAAFFYALNALGSHITVRGLFGNSLQGDKACLSHLERLCEGFATIDLSDHPDLGPVLFAVAAAKHGGRFTGTRRLQYKESDRAAAMAQELAAFGTQVTVEENAVTIVPAAFHAPSRPLQGHNDHRIVMALAVLLTLTGGTLTDSQAVSKSFPSFFEKLKQLGIDLQTQTE